MFFIGAAVTYPVVRFVYSWSGAKDLVSAGNHLFHARIKNAFSSTITASAKFFMGAGACYLLSEMFVFSPQPIERVSEFGEDSIENTRHLENWSFQKGSEAEKIALFCTQFLEKKFPNNYMTVLYCVEPVNRAMKKDPNLKGLLENLETSAPTLNKWVQNEK